MTVRPQPFKDRVREERRRSLLDAARRLFVAHGYAGTTIEAIAEAAGVGKGTVYLHFATKDELLVELMTEATEDVLRQIAELQGGGLSVAEQLAACVRICARSFLDNHELIATNLPALRDVFAARLGAELPSAAVLRQIAELVRSGQQRGELRAALDPEVVGLMVMTLAQIPSGFREVRGVTAAAADAALEQAIAVLLQGIAAPSALPPPLPR